MMKAEAMRKHEKKMEEIETNREVGSRSRIEKMEKKEEEDDSDSSSSSASSSSKSSDSDDDDSKMSNEAVSK